MHNQSDGSVKGAEAEKLKEIEMSVADEETESKPVFSVLVLTNEMLFR